MNLKNKYLKKTLYWDKSIEKKLTAEQKRTGVSQSQIIQALVENYL